MLPRTTFVLLALLVGCKTFNTKQTNHPGQEPINQPVSQQPAGNSVSQGYMSRAAFKSATREQLSLLDTIRVWNVDTESRPINYDLNFRSDKNLTDFFQAYQLKTLTPPGVKNEVYKAIEAESKKNEQKAKESLFNRLNFQPHFDDALRQEQLLSVKSFDELKNCRLEWFPTYYLSPNVSQIKEGESISQYYTLDTLGTTYKVILNNKIVGFLSYNTRSQLWSSVKLYLETYQKIVELGGEPIGFTYGVGVQGVYMGGFPNVFGFINNGKLIFVHNRYTQATIQFTNSPPLTKPHHEFEIISVDNSYSKSRLVSGIEYMLKRLRGVIEKMQIE